MLFTHDNELIQKPNRVNIDWESFSKSILKTVGAHRYAMDKSTEPLCLGYAFNQDDPRIWVAGERPPRDLFDAIREGYLVYAWNTGFEYALWRYIAVDQWNWPEIPFTSWRDTQAIALSFALPASLEECGRVLNLDIQKDKRGKDLINWLCKPQKLTKKNPFKRWTPETHPELFIEIYEYCKDDVNAERAILDYLPWELQDVELDLWRATLLKNNRGIPIDTTLVNASIQKIDEYLDEVLAMIPIITDGAIDTINQGKKIIEWAMHEHGFPLPNFRAETVEAALKDPNIDNYPSVKSLLELRALAGKSSIKKYRKVKQAICPDGRVRDCLKYHKATTGREGGRLLQPQNLPTETVGDGAEQEVEDAVYTFIYDSFDQTLLKYENLIETASALIRPSICAPFGKRFIVADYASIEHLVVCWLAGQEDILQKFISGMCLYRDMASALYDVPYEEISKTSKMRKHGKITVLGCDYMMGGKVFRVNCANKGLFITQGEANRTIDIFREKHSMVKALWYGLKDAAENATINVGNMYSYGRISFIHDKGFLFMILPTGKCLAYPNARYEEYRAPWGDYQTVVVHDGYIDKHWTRVGLSPGRITENATQATAREILMEAILDLERAGYEIILSVHDEVIAEVDNGFGSLEEVIHILCNRSDTFFGLPLRAEGYVAQRFKK